MIPAPIFAALIAKLADATLTLFVVSDSASTVAVMLMHTLACHKNAVASLDYN
jgi:hypothetical protein